MNQENLSGKVRVFETPEALIQETSQFILSLSSSSERFSLSLSGGSTPQALYAHMATQPFAWQNIHFFWGDERWVSPDHERSNFRMVREALLNPARVPSDCINPVPTFLKDPLDGAAVYEKTIRTFFGSVENQPPAFDLILLGLGDDGHTASLFPGDAALEESQRLICTAKQNSDDPRITFTYPLIQNAKNIVFLVTGKKKNAILKEFVHRENRPVLYPAERVPPVNGNLYWFLDRDAAEGL